MDIVPKTTVISILDLKCKIKRLEEELNQAKTNYSSALKRLECNHYFLYKETKSMFSNSNIKSDVYVCSICGEIGVINKIGETV